MGALNGLVFPAAGWRYLRSQKVKRPSERLTTRGRKQGKGRKRPRLTPT